MLFCYYDTRDYSYTVTSVTRDSLRLKVSGISIVGLSWTTIYGGIRDSGLRLVELILNNTLVKKHQYTCA